MIFLPIILLILLNIILLIKVKDFFNPFTMMSLFFFLPMGLSTLRLSGLQKNTWSFESNLMIWASIIVWGLVPFVILLLFGKINKSEIVYTKSIYKIIRYACFAFIAIFLIENKILFHSYIPILSKNLILLFEKHYASLSFWGIITKGSPLFCTLALRNYLLFRKKSDLILTIICLLLPITRISRLDIMFSVISLFTLLSLYNSISWRSLVKSKYFFGVILLSVVLFFVFIVSGNFRSSHGNEYEFSTKKVFQYKGDPGPGEIFAWAYSYFCLPFEDSDRIIANYQNKKFYGQLSISPIVNGIFFGHVWGNFPNPDIIYNYNERFTNFFAVPTALPYFYMDLGVIGGTFSMLIYQIILLTFYLKSSKSEFAKIAYSIFLAAFCLSSFQAFIMSAQTTRMILIALILFTLPNFFRKKNEIPTEV